MGNPVPWMLAASTAFKVGGTLVETQAARAEADADMNIARVNAEATGQQTSLAEDAQRRQARQFLARQRAAIGDANIEDSGTVRQVQEQSAVEAELDALNIRYGGAMKRNSYLAEQDAARVRGKAITRTGYMKAAGQLLGGGGDVMAARKQYGK